LRRLFPRLIAFIRGRQIFDPVVVAMKALTVELGKLGVLCILDLEKAYNHVNWDFLLYMVFFLGNHFMIVINGRIS
jgi:hypothetical protein